MFWYSVLVKACTLHKINNFASLHCYNACNILSKYAANTKDGSVNNLMPDFYDRNY